MIWIAVPVAIAVVGLLLLRRYGQPSRDSGWDGGDPAYDAWSTSADVSSSPDSSFAGGGGDFGGAGATGEWSDSSGGSDGGGDSGGGDGGGDSGGGD